MKIREISVSDGEMRIEIAHSNNDIFSLECSLYDQQIREVFRTKEIECVNICGGDLYKQVVENEDEFDKVFVFILNLIHYMQTNRFENRTRKLKVDTNLSLSEIKRSIWAYKIYQTINNCINC